MRHYSTELVRSMVGFPLGLEMQLLEGFRSPRHLSTPAQVLKSRFYIYLLPLGFLWVHN